MIPLDTFFIKKMLKQNTEKQITISIFMEYSLFERTITHLSSCPHLDNHTNFPQLTIQKELNLPIPFIGIILTKTEYNSFLKEKLKKILDMRSEMSHEEFISLLLHKESTQKYVFFLRHTFLESSTRDDLYSLKLIFEKNGFKNIKFNIIVENSFDLLQKNFLSPFYQIPTNFKFSKIESFFRNIFKRKMIQSLSCIKDLIFIFKRENVNFICQQNLTIENEGKDFLDYFRKIGLQNSFFEKDFCTIKQPQISPLFMEHFSSLLKEGKHDLLYKSIAEAKYITDKYSLKKNIDFKFATKETINDLISINKDFCEIAEKPLFKKQFLKISTEACSLKHVIPYVEEAK